MWAAPPTTWPQNSVSRPGGGGVVASLSVARATPDGYTLLLTGIGPACLRPLIDKNVGYDPDADFTPLILIGETPNVLVANPKLGPRTVQDLVAYAKRKGGKLTIGHSGPGTMGHLSTVLFGSEAGLEVSSISSRHGADDARCPRRADRCRLSGLQARQAILLAVTSGERVDFLPMCPR